nr:hydantoinase B/oxoprolinase family protein [Roseobacter sp. MED193]
MSEGIYKNVLKMDGYENELELHAALTVPKDSMHVDFSGTTCLSKKGTNVPLNYATAYTVFALRCLVGRISAIMRDLWHHSQLMDPRAVF